MPTSNIHAFPYSVKIGGLGFESVEAPGTAKARRTRRPDRCTGPPPPPHLPRHQPGAPPTGGMWTWTEAHVGDPSQRAQGMGGYRYRPTVGCGSPHDAMGIGTHNHRPRGDAGAAPTRGPHNTSHGRHTEHKTKSAMSRASRSSGSAGMHVEGHTRLQPVAKSPLRLPYIYTCCGVCVPGTCSPLFSASEVHFDPWGLHARHAATLPRGGPIGL